MHVDFIVASDAVRVYIKCIQYYTLYRGLETLRLLYTAM